MAKLQSTKFKVCLGRTTALQPQLHSMSCKVTGHSEGDLRGNKIIKEKIDLQNISRLKKNEFLAAVTFPLVALCHFARN